MFARIVVGTDGSQTATRAVRRAVDLAREGGGTLHLVTAHEPVSVTRIQRQLAEVPDELRAIAAIQDEAEQQLERVADELRAEHGVEVRTHALEGEPADAILRIAEQYRADLIVVGNKGMQGARRFLLGSVPNKVSHHAPCDLLIVRTVGVEDGG